MVWTKVPIKKWTHLGQFAMTFRNRQAWKNIGFVSFYSMGHKQSTRRMYNFKNTLINTSPHEIRPSTFNNSKQNTFWAYSHLAFGPLQYWGSMKLRPVHRKGLERERSDVRRRQRFDFIPSVLCWNYEAGISEKVSDYNVNPPKPIQKRV